MKIDSKKFLNFVKKATLSGKIGSGSIIFTGTTIQSELQTGGISAVKANLIGVKTTKPFTLNIKNFITLIRILGSFEGILEIVQEDNKVKFMTNTDEAEITLADEDFVKESNATFPPINIENQIQLDSSILKKISSKMSLLPKDQAEEITITVKNGLLKLVIGNEEFDTLTTKQQTKIKDDIIVKFNLEMLNDIFQSVDGIISISLKTNSVLYVKYIMEKEATFEYLIAPRVTEE